ncbi:MAG: VanZ family protein [Ruminococcus sp.]|nr:VanZ family protein [Ruminococcus sp.]
MREIYIRVYHIDLLTAALIMLGLVIVWSVIGVLFAKNMRTICVTAVVISGVIIFLLTLCARGEVGASRDMMPLALFRRGVNEPPILRSIMMNVFLFIPLGMSLPYLIRSSAWIRMLLTVLIGFCVSCGIELIQRFFAVGMTQADDVISNTLGMAIGACTYPLTLLWAALIRKYRGKDRTPRE